jgi:hypothetical protein
MRIKPFKIFEAKKAKKVDDREAMLRECFFNIEDLVNVEDIHYIKNNKDYYTVRIEFSELESGFESAIERHLLQAEVLKLISKDLRKIEDAIEFNFEENFKEYEVCIELSLHFVDNTSTDIDINEVIFLDSYSYSYDKIKIKRFFKLKYNLDVTSSSVSEDETKYGDPYTKLSIKVSQSEEEAKECRDKIAHDFSLIKGIDEYGFEGDFIEELSIYSFDGQTVIDIYPDTSLSL